MKLLKLLIVIQLFVMAACGKQDVTVPSVPSMQEAQNASQNLPSFNTKNIAIPQQLTPLTAFDFSQPYEVKVMALGCGIGCPIYRFTLKPDGTGVFEGIAFVKEKSSVNFVLTPSVKSGWNFFLKEQQTKVTSLRQKECRHRPTDAVRYRMIVLQGDKTFQSVIEQGCQEQSLLSLERLLDDTVGRWKGKRYKSVR